MYHRDVLYIISFIVAVFLYDGSFAFDDILPYRLWIVQIIDVTVRIYDARISIRYHVLLSMIDAKFKLLACFDHDVCLETLQLRIVIARKELAPRHFWRELSEHVHR